MNSASLIKRFDRIYDSIWTEFDAVVEFKPRLEQNLLTDDQLDRLAPFETELLIVGQGLRGFAKSCTDLAREIAQRSAQIDSSTKAKAHFETVAEFAERYAEAQIAQFRGIRESLEERSK